MAFEVDTERLREAITALAAIERPPTSQGEREAALALAERFRRLGLDPRIDEGQAYDSYARPIGAMAAAGLAGGLLALAGARRVGSLLGAAAAAGIAEDISNGPRLFRLATIKLRATRNVVTPAGDTSA
ncbi:MAG: hypothetical protein NVSMB51_03080 [Solirubrobacteraceae bacterium]